MKLSRIAYGSTDFATAILPRFKQWARIDHDDDDESLATMLAACAASLERQWGICFVPAEYLWIPVESVAVPPDAVARFDYVPIPLRGITRFVVKRGGADLSETFTLSGDLVYADFGPMYLHGVGGAAIQADDVVTLKTPDDPDAQQLPPDLWAALSRYALFVWENRQSAQEGSVSEMPDWKERVWAEFWSPRV